MLRENETSAKAAARRSALSRRAALMADVKAKSEHIVNSKLISLLESDGSLSDKSPQRKTIAVYCSLPRELSLDIFIAHIYAKGCRVCFPSMERLSDGKSTMTFRCIEEDEWRGRAASFLQNPAKTQDLYADLAGSSKFSECSADNIDTIIVPLVAFDKFSNRLGYGGGNYDRYLARLKSSCNKIGVAFACQEMDNLATDAHDIALNCVISA